jgi:hypothetical protein
MVLRPKPSNRSASSVLHTRPPPSDACHLHGQHGHSHVFSHLSMSQVSASAASHLASGSLGPSLTSVLHPSGPSAWHILLDLHLAVGYRLRAPHLHNTSQETCRTQGFRQGRVSHHSTYFVDHIDNHSSQNEHTRVLVNLVFAISFFLSSTFSTLCMCHKIRYDKYCSTFLILFLGTKQALYGNSYILPTKKNTHVVIPIDHCAGQYHGAVW